MRLFELPLSGSPLLWWARKSLLVLLLLGVSVPVVQAQTRRNCGTMEYWDSQLRSNPALNRRMMDVENRTREQAKSGFRAVTGKVNIPVVVHVIYRTGEQNISEAQIRSQIRVLNEDFQRKNADRVKTPAMFGMLAANSGISFQLANRDPQGNPTSGITRHQTSTSAFFSSDNGAKYAAMGGVDAWPSDQYLNIWVCNLGLGILGYSQFPGGPAETDGVVISYKFFGTTGVVKRPFHLGRTTTHEVGHWLNLRHIWGDGPCGVDDLVDDTPGADGPNHGCAFGHSSCGSVNMTQNFMDYTDDACMNLFTKGQANRMRALFAPGGPRRSLLFSPGLVKEQAPIVSNYQPQNFQVHLVADNKVRMTWAPVDGADKYRARIRRAGTEKWIPRVFSNTYINASGLQLCTDYEIQLETIIAGKGKGYTSSKYFKTGGCSNGSSTPVQVTSGPAKAPQTLAASQLAERELRIFWEAVPGAVGYRVQYKASNGTKVFAREVKKNELILTNLVSGVRYFYRVKAIYPDKAGPYTPVGAYFLGGLSRMSMRTQQDYMRVEKGKSGTKIGLAFQTTQPMPVKVSVWDAYGRKVKSYPLKTLYPGKFLPLDIVGLPRGSLLLRMEDRDGFVYEKKIAL